jgi:Zn-dependent peptidase ImmA (M78 family)
MDSENLVLTLRSSASDLDVAFAVAHELRHLWQQQTERFDLEEHAVPGSVSTIDYNLQAEEIDANAFGALVMESFFHVRPTFPSLPPDLVQMIDARKHTILKEVFQ